MQYQCFGGIQSPVSQTGCGRKDPRKGICRRRYRAHSDGRRKTVCRCCVACQTHLLLGCTVSGDSIRAAGGDRRPFRFLSLPWVRKRVGPRHRLCAKPGFMHHRAIVCSRRTSKDCSPCHGKTYYICKRRPSHAAPCRRLRKSF